jgi:hypothetical protein
MLKPGDVIIPHDVTKWAKNMIGRPAMVAGVFKNDRVDLVVMDDITDDPISIIYANLKNASECIIIAAPEQK